MTVDGAATWSDVVTENVILCKSVCLCLGLCTVVVQARGFAASVSVSVLCAETGGSAREMQVGVDQSPHGMAGVPMLGCGALSDKEQRGGVGGANKKPKFLAHLFAPC